MALALIIVSVVVGPLLVAFILGGFKFARQLDRRMAADDLRWKQNEADHNRAFKEIGTLKQGQLRIEQKIDELTRKVEQYNGRS